MSQGNVEIVRCFLEAWKAGDLEAALALFDDKLLTRRLTPLPDSAIGHGGQGMLDAAAGWLGVFGKFTMQGEEFIDAGDHVVVRVAQEGGGDASRAPMTGRFWFVFGVRDRKVVAFDIYLTRKKALEAASLPEFRLA